jgi:hypothetical protein
LLSFLSLRKPRRHSAQSGNNRDNDSLLHRHLFFSKTHMISADRKTPRGDRLAFDRPPLFAAAAGSLLNYRKRPFDAQRSTPSDRADIL